MRTIRSLPFLALCLVFSAIPFSAAQQPAASTGAGPSGPAPVPGVDLEPVTEYPTMLPVLQMRVNLNSDGNGNLGILSVVSKALAAKQPWDCKTISSYDVEDTTTKKRVAIANLRLEEPTTSGAATSCTIGTVALAQHPAVVLVLKDHQVAKQDKLTVALANLPAPLTGSASAAVSLSDPAISSLQTNLYALTIAPQAAPSETLTNGKKRDTGQLAISFTEPELAPAFHAAALFVSTTDLFSTDERDAKSAFAGTVGLKRGLLSRWYLPGSIQQTVQGNQVATSLSTVTTAGVSSLLPPNWSKGTLYNDGFQAPNPPEFTLNANYTHRLAQAVTKSTPLLAVNDFSLNPSATLTPIYILPKVCSAYQKHIGRGANTSTTSSKQYCLALQTDIGMWYLPLDTTKSGSQRAEGYGDVSFLLPLTDIPFASGPITSLIMGSTTNAQLHIKYSDDVNAANNYARTKDWTFAFEVIK